MPRPKQFDVDDVLEKAMFVFWESGYAATSISTLVQAMGINPFSLYDTFGNKHALFLAVLDRYASTVTRHLYAPLYSPSPSLAEIADTFRNVIDNGEGDGRRGCLILHAVAEFGIGDELVARRSRAHLDHLRELFASALRNARQRGEIDSGQELEGLSSYLTGSLAGLQIFIRAGLPQPLLESQTRVVLSSLGTVPGRTDALAARSPTLESSR